MECLDQLHDLGASSMQRTSQHGKIARRGVAAGSDASSAPRQLHGKRRAAAERAYDFDSAVHRLDQSFTMREPEAGPFDPALGRTETFVGSEQTREVLADPQVSGDQTEQVSHQTAKSREDRRIRRLRTARQGR